MLLVAHRRVQPRRTTTAWEKLGYAKRDILVSRVEKARDTQTEAKQQFASTLDQFKALTGFNGGELEAEYAKLNASYEDCDDGGGRRDQGGSTRSTRWPRPCSTEWQKELDQYQDQSLRAASAEKLTDSRASGTRPAAGRDAGERVGHEAGSGVRSTTGC